MGYNTLLVNLERFHVILVIWTEFSCTFLPLVIWFVHESFIFHYDTCMQCLRFRPLRGFWIFLSPSWNKVFPRHDQPFAALDIGRWGFGGKCFWSPDLLTLDGVWKVWVTWLSFAWVLKRTQPNDMVEQTGETTWLEGSLCSWLESLSFACYWR